MSKYAILAAALLTSSLTFANAMPAHEMPMQPTHEMPAKPNLTMEQKQAIGKVLQSNGSLTQKAASIHAIVKPATNMPDLNDEQKTAIQHVVKSSMPMGDKVNAIGNIVHPMPPVHPVMPEPTAPVMEK